jgi:hypothetical protein
MSDNFREMANDYNNIDIFYNGASTNAQRTRKLVQKRFSHWENGPRVEYHQTPPNIDDFKEIVVNAIEAKDGDTITGSISGDGSLNHHMLIKQDPSVPAIVKDSPIWTPGGGNAINLFKALTDRIDYRHPEQVIKTGTISEFYPLHIKSINGKGELEDMFAASIFSVGAMALAASYLNDSEYRQSHLRNRKYGEIITDPIRVLKSLKQTKPYIYYDKRDGFKQAYDILFINSPKIAKVIHAKDVKLTGPAYKLEIKDRQVREVVSSIARLAIGKANGEYLTKPYSFTVLSEDVLAQVDGENWKLDVGTSLEVGYASTPIKVVTTLKNP